MRKGWSAGVLMTAALALGACATESADSGSARVSNAGTGQSAAAGGVARTGASIAAMSDQYSHPRPVGTAATGASAWVGPPPEPAFVASGPLPPAAPPPPPLAAVANRQPSTPETPASEVVRPEAAAPAPPQAGAPANVDLAAGRALFNQWSCATCHILADANASGSVGPSLDGNSQLSKEVIVRIVTSGQGAMPAFGGQIDDADIALLADYIVAAKK